MEELVVLRGCRKLVKIEHFWGTGGRYSAVSSMKRYLHNAFLGSPILITCICVVAWQMASAQPSNPTMSENPAGLSTEEIVGKLVRRNLERSQALAAYQGTRTYRLEYHGFPGSRAAEMVVDVSYRAPGTKEATKEFTIRSESGSKLLIERVFKRMLQSEKESVSQENQRGVALNRDNYSFSLVEQEKTPSGPVYVLSVEPRTRNKLLYRGRIWVDAVDFAVMRIEGEPAKNPSFWTKETHIEQVYTKIGDFWLPRSNRSTTTIRLGGHALFTIDYGDYQITAATPPRPVGNDVAGYR